MPPEKLQEVVCKQFFADPTQWRDERWSKPSPRHPDFKHKESKVALWLNNWHKPAWVDAQLATCDAGVKKTPESVSTLVQSQEPFEGHSEVRICRELCEDGRISDAVDALRLLVQRGCHVPNILFYRVLKRCIVHKDLVSGRCIDALAVKSGYEGDAFLATQLIGLYASHRRLEEAMRVFNKVSRPNSYNWATIIFAYARYGGATGAAEAIRLYGQMCGSTTVKPDDRIYSAVLKACATAGNLVTGKEVHAHILASPRKPDRFVQAGLVDMYAKCGSLKAARNLFDRLPDRNVVIWNTMIAGYAQHGMGPEALGLYIAMQQEGLVSPDSVTFVCLLQACASVGVTALREGKQVHAQLRERGLQEDVVLGGSLINMYAKCGSLDDARQLFDRLPQRNVVTWNAMIAGYVQQGLGQEALNLYRRMQQEGLIPPNSVTYACLLQASASIGVGALDEGKQLHAQIKEQGQHEEVYLAGSLVNMYAKCGSLENARRFFDGLPTKNIVTWTAMFAGYAQQGMGQEALKLYSSMQLEGLIAPNSVTYVCLIQACASVGVEALLEGQQLHAQIKERGLEKDVVLGGSLVNMYAKCGSLEDARELFDRLPERNLVTWNTMIAGYAQQGMGQEALSLYNSMKLEHLIQPNCVTYACLLQACAALGLGGLQEGKQLHGLIDEQLLQQDVVLGGCLVNMYSKCGALEHARRLFDKLTEKNAVAWTAMLAGYAQQGLGEEALSLFSSMEQEGISLPDSVTYVCLLQACGSVGVGALEQGKKLHAKIKEQGLHDDVVLGGSLVNMYVKCGSLEDARRLFDILPERSVIAWTAMLAGYAQQGMGQEALTLYSSMQQEGLTPPNSVTFLSLLQACASVGAGALNEGKQLHAQIKERGLQEDVVLGGSLVNLYAKCSSLQDARQLFDRLPERNVVAWNSMLAAYAQQDMGEEALSLYSSMLQEGLTPDSITFLCLLQACGAVAALSLGKQLHAEIQERGMQGDVVLGAALVNMYAKCGSMFDSQQVFDLLPERSVEAWGALLGGYAREGNSEVVFDLFDRMTSEGMQPDGITFLSVLTVCSHAGLVGEGRKYFEGMREYGVSATLDHFTCMMDLLGRAGHVGEALEMAKSMPYPPNGAVWHTLLGACQKWSNVEVGEQAFDFAVKLDRKNPASYVLMSNIYARAEMWEEAKEMQSRRRTCEAWKTPGQSWWTDMTGVVHTFVVGDKKHPESEGNYSGEVFLWGLLVGDLTATCSSTATCDASREVLAVLIGSRSTVTCVTTAGERKHASLLHIAIKKPIAGGNHDCRYMLGFRTHN